MSFCCEFKFIFVFLLLSDSHCSMPKTVLSIHRGSKIAMSLCLCRLPRIFSEPAFIRSYRNWKEDWEQRTKNNLNIADGLAYLKTPGHFLAPIEERNRKKRLQEGSHETPQEEVSAINSNEIDLLIASEGIPELSINALSDQEGKSRNETTNDVRMIHAGDSPGIQWLVVRYKQSPDIWTFPFAHRRDRDTAQSTLKRMCSNHLGLSPFFPSFSPVLFRDLPSPSNEIPTRLFYYKGIHVAKTLDVEIPGDSPLAEYAWVSRKELEMRLSPSAWHCIKCALPLE